MAAVNIPRSFQQWPNAIAVAPVSATPGTFNLDAGTYGLALTATVWGTAILQKLMPDGVTWVPVNGGGFAGDGYSTLTLPAGQYRLVLAGLTALIGEIALISRGGLFR